MIFLNRKEAGQKLATLMTKYRNRKNAIVIGLPRGGVVTAYEVAKELNLPLDIVCPRKVGAPLNPELALGAVFETGEGYFNHYLIERLGVSEEYLKNEIEKEKKQSHRRMELYRQKRPPLNLEDKIVILVDDGLATGASMKAAIEAVRAEGAAEIILAIPVSPPDTLEELQTEVNEIFCLYSPSYFQAVGEFYEDFSQTEDEEVIKLMNEKSLS